MSGYTSPDQVDGARFARGREILGVFVIPTRLTYTLWVSLKIGLLSLGLGGMQAAMGAVDFQIVGSGTTGESAVTVGPGGSFGIDIRAQGITPATGSRPQGELDSLTYRVVFPNEGFTLLGNSFGGDFDEVLFPSGFNGSIPWVTGGGVPITNSADTGSPGATASVADLYRTTASRNAIPLLASDVVESLSLVAPTAQGVYTINLSVLEAADTIGELHETADGGSFRVEVIPEPATLVMLSWLGVVGLRRRIG